MTVYIIFPFMYKYSTIDGAETRFLQCALLIRTSLHTARWLAVAVAVAVAVAWVQLAAKPSSYGRAIAGCR